jgi:uncharacterized membrane protein YjfL (UPF0719 family)
MLYRWNVKKIILQILVMYFVFTSIYILFDFIFGRISRFDTQYVIQTGLHSLGLVTIGYIFRSLIYLLRKKW